MGIHRLLLAAMIFSGLGFRAFAADAPTPPPGQVRLPSMGVTAAPPAGWMRTKEPEESTVAQWVRLNPAGTGADGLLRLEIYEKKLPTVEAFADAIAAQTHAKVTGPARLAGLEATELAGTPQAPAAGKTAALYMVVGRMTERGDYYYGLYCFATPAMAATARAGFDAVGSGLVLSDPTPAADALAPRDPAQDVPFGLFDTGVVFTLPDPYRLAKRTDHQARYIIDDFATKKLGVELDMTLAPTHGADLETIEGKLASAAAQLGYANAPEWTRTSGTPAVAYSAPIPNVPPADGKSKKTTQLMIVMVGPEQHALFIFQYFGDDAAAYAAAVEHVADSVRVSKAYQEGVKAGEGAGEK